MFKISEKFTKDILGLKELDFSRGMIGIEKEGLRISGTDISQRTHFHELGSALCNQYITTDFSEALLEFITPPLSENLLTFQFLEDIHSFVFSNIDNEVLWPFSMPIDIRSDSDIPIAMYGDSNMAMLKTIYRNGLSNRYSRHMQTISGIHFNYSLTEQLWKDDSLLDQSKSLTDIKSDIYFGGLRNLQKMNWIILYLFGASPIIPKSLLKNTNLKFKKLDDEYYYLDNGTSLRMSNIGYQTPYQNKLDISTNSINEYIRDLLSATETRSEIFQGIPTIVNDVSSQLNVNILQIEDEYYSFARPKSSSEKDIRTLSKLKKNGVDYLEYRSVDLNPFHRSGIDLNTIYFLELFLLYCCIKDSPMMTRDDQKESKSNTLKVATRGREKGLSLFNDQKKIGLKDWSRRIIDEMMVIAEIIENDDTKYVDSIHQALLRLESPENTPSAIIIDKLVTGDQSYEEFGITIGLENKREFSNYQNQSLKVLEDEAKSSLNKQIKIERKDKKSFEEYFKDYMGSAEDTLG